MHSKPLPTDPAILREMAAELRSFIEEWTPIVETIRSTGRQPDNVPYPFPPSGTVGPPQLIYSANYLGPPFNFGNPLESGIGHAVARFSDPRVGEMSGVVKLARSLLNDVLSALSTPPPDIPPPEGPACLSPKEPPPDGPRADDLSDPLMVPVRRSIALLLEEIDYHETMRRAGDDTSDSGASILGTLNMLRDAVCQRRARDKRDPIGNPVAFYAIERFLGEVGSLPEPWEPAERDVIRLKAWLGRLGGPVVEQPEPEPSPERVRHLMTLFPAGRALLASEGAAGSRRRTPGSEPPRHLHRFGKIEGSSAASVGQALEALLKSTEAWMRMTPGMRRRDPTHVGAYVRGRVRTLNRRLAKVARAHDLAELAPRAVYAQLSEMLRDEDSDRWPEGLTQDHLTELRSFLSLLPAPAAPLVAPSPAGSPPAIVAPPEPPAIVAPPEPPAIARTQAPPAEADGPVRPALLAPSVPQVRELVEAIGEYFATVERSAWPSCWWRQEDHVYPWFARLADAINAVRPVAESCEGWPNRVRLAMPEVIEAFDRVAEDWGWSELARPEPERTAYRDARLAWFAGAIERPRFEAALSIRAGWRGMADYDANIDGIAEEGKAKGFGPTMTPVEGVARFQDADKAFWLTCRLGTKYPVIDDGLRSKLMAGYGLLNSALGDLDRGTPVPSRPTSHAAQRDGTAGPPLPPEAATAFAPASTVPARPVPRDTRPPDEPLTLDDKAVALLTRWMKEGRSRMSKRGLATELRCHHSSLEDCPTFLALWESYKGKPKSGYRDANTGNIEADDDD